jgi:hypothetical protein
MELASPNIGIEQDVSASPLNPVLAPTWGTQTARLTAFLCDVANQNRACRGGLSADSTGDTLQERRT